MTKIKIAHLWYDPVGEKAPWKALYLKWDKICDNRFFTKEEGIEALTNAGYEVKLEVPK
jgi:hypothetical protein